MSSGYAYDDILIMPGMVSFGVEEVDLTSRITKNHIVPSASTRFGSLRFTVSAGRLAQGTSRPSLRSKSDTALRSLEVAYRLSDNFFSTAGREAG